LSFVLTASRDSQQASCININDHDLYHQEQSEVLMPTSWPKGRCYCSFISPAALHDITQPAVAFENGRLGLVDQPTSTKEIFCFPAFLHGEVFPALPTTPFFFDSLMLGGFLRAGFSRKELFFSFHLSCLPCPLTFSITTLEHSVASIKHTYRDRTRWLHLLFFTTKPKD
jgi:hypothetical protein